MTMPLQNPRRAERPNGEQPRPSGLRPVPPARVRDVGLPPVGRQLFDTLLQLNLMAADQVEAFLQRMGRRAADFTTAEQLGRALVREGILTDYQLDRILAGTTHGLALGNYRILDRLGAGAMGVVFLAEHLLMKRRAAVKVLPVDDSCPAAILDRFYSEMRVLADLHHPHIVMAYDAGTLAPPNPSMPLLLYLVMELVPGGDLENLVDAKGPVPVAQACDWIRQAACGLQEAHDHHLIHRDVKPSNLLLTAEGQVKLVDFGLARQFCSRITDPRVLLGTVEYMAPEQSRDASAVRSEADIYGLGATLFWLLTGQPPFPPSRTVGEGLRLLQESTPRRLRSLRPEVPAELEELVARLIHRDPTQRPALPLTVMNNLLPFVSTSPADLATNGLSLTGPFTTPSKKRVLVVDDDPVIRRLCRTHLEQRGYLCDEVEDGPSGLAMLQARPYDLVLLDLNLPGLNGYEVCRRARERPLSQRLKIVVISGQGDQNELAETLSVGADDFISKPFELRLLDAKVHHALRLKEAQDRADLLAGQLLQTNNQLEQSLTARLADVRQAEGAVLFAMARMAELRDGETAGHLRRMQQYCRRLAKQAAEEPPWAGLVDERFLAQLLCCVPLHDIGKIGLPDHVLLKNGPLDKTERALMETHPLIGDRILDALGREHGAPLEFLTMATAIVRHHHERYDGNGYPDRLIGNAIPAAARLVAVADVYDALRRNRPHKPAWPHAESTHFILEKSAGQFDPTLLKAFALCHLDFERLYRNGGE